MQCRMPATNRAHKSAVLGAGVGGLAAVKCCLDEGIEPVCFEQHQDIGGIWFYTPHKRPNQGAASFSNLVTNTTREISCYSDFPIPADYPMYLGHRDFHQYLRSYAEHFDLLRHIRFNTEVIRVWPTEEYPKTGQWNVIVKSRDWGIEEHFVFDSVFVCTGMMKDPMSPNIPGRENFTGEVMHMLDYRMPDIFANKRVLVIGNSHSAGDAVSDAAATCEQAYLSVGRSGFGFLPRLDSKGFPNELASPGFLARSISVKTLGRIMSALSKSCLDLKPFNIKPAGNPLTDGVVMINDDIKYKLVTGKVKVVGVVEKFTETGVQMEGGGHLDVDLILMATGYKSNYDFIDVDCIKGRDFRMSSGKSLFLYKMVFPLDLTHPTLVMASSFNVFGSHIPALELRCRWAAHVLTGKCHLPDHKLMTAHTKKAACYAQKECRGIIKIPWFHYCDSIANEIDAKPSLISVFIRSPSLAFKMLVGPVFPQHYRLLGPDSSASAWDNSHAAYDRIFPNRNKKLKLALWLFVSALSAHLLYRCIY